MRDRQSIRQADRQTERERERVCVSVFTSEYYVRMSEKITCVRKRRERVSEGQGYVYMCMESSGGMGGPGHWDHSR